MDNGIISMRYAKALLRFAIENGEEKKVYEETSLLAETFLNVPALQEALINPVLTAKEKKQLLISAACGKNKPSASYERFVKLVIRKGRADIMQFVAQSYGTVYRKMKGIIRGKLVVPTKISDKLVKKLQAMVENVSHCKVDFKVSEDPAIEGGFILEYDTYRLDASVRSQIAKLKRELC